MSDISQFYWMLFLMSQWGRPITLGNNLVVNGKIGIGTAAPTYLLHAAGAGAEYILVESTDSYSGLMAEGGAAGDVRWGFLSGYPNAGDCTIREMGTANYLTIKKTTGLVGIGTAAPDVRIHAYDSGAACYVRAESGVGSTAGFNMKNSEGEYQLYTDADKLWFRDVVDAATRMVIDGDGRVGIGTTAPDTSSKLDITSTAGALLLPRMTTTQRNALTAANGMILYNTTTATIQGYQGGAWTDL